MIVDYRIWCTAYALLTIVYAGGFFMIARAEPGTPAFRTRLDAADKYMRAVLAAIALVGALNYFDWLWS